ncbi:ComEC/Rec2 family competence protein, partial [Bordetella bronchiseptica]
PRGMRARLRAALLGFGRTQMAVTLALTPLLAFLVRQVSLGSPLANALAIPVVSLAVTPLALLCGALSALPGGQGPVAQFMYGGPGGQRLTLYVTREAQGDQTAFRFTQDGPVRVFYWVEGKFGYALSGELERDALLKVAQEVYRELG